MIVSSIPFYPSKHSHDIALTWTAWPAIDELWKVKRRHTAALKMTRELVGMDTSWKKSIISEVPDKTIDLGKADCLDNDVRKIIGVQGKEREGQQSDTTDKNGNANKEGPSKNRTNNYTLLLIAASEGIVEIFEAIL
jgi:hypothetical protein